MKTNKNLELMKIRIQEAKQKAVASSVYCCINLEKMEFRYIPLREIYFDEGLSLGQYISNLKESHDKQLQELREQLSLVIDNQNKVIEFLAEEVTKLKIL